MKKIILAIGLVFTLVSCEDFFEPKLSNERTLDQIIEDKPEDILNWVTKSYRSFAATPDSWSNNNFLDCATDNAVTNVLTADINNMQTVNGYWRSTANPVGDWAARFDDIRHINMFLEIGRDPSIRYKKSDAVADSLLRNRVTSEAFFMRAYEQFLLLRHNAGYDDAGNLLGYPIMTTVMDADNYEQLARDSYEDCVAQIVEDIDSAIAYGGLPVEWKNTPYNDIDGDENYGRPTHLACLALKSRVLLYAASPAFTAHLGDADKKAKYALAAQAALDFIDHEKVGRSLPNVYNNNPLQPNLISESYFNNPENEELIMRRLLGQNGSGSTGLAERNYPPVTELEGAGRCNPTQNLVDAFPMIDGYPRGKSPNITYSDANMYDFRDPRLTMTVLHNGSVFANADGSRSVTIETFSGGNCMSDGNDPNVTEDNSTRTGYFLRKWLDPGTSLIEGNVSGSQYYNVIFRKGEIFLNYAEAAYYAYGWEGADLGYTAKEALKEVRRRAGVAALSVEDDYLNEVSGDDVEALIKNERRIELCFEGHRFWDVRRWKDSLTEPIEGVSITNNNGLLDIKRKTLFTPVYDESYMHYLPIPNNEILNTELIKQNQGW